jgi:hypothetical protein
MADQESGMYITRPENTDVAALSAGAIAVVIALAINPGAWDVTGLIVGFTLVVVILGFSWEKTRWWLQSLAIAASIALASLPAIDFVNEAYHSHDWRAYLVGSYALHCGDDPSKDDPSKDPCNKEGKPESRVTVNQQAISWFIVLIIILAGDLLLQRARRNTAPRKGIRGAPLKPNG